jgi:hypothetical protein
VHSGYSPAAEGDVDGLFVIAGLNAVCPGFALFEGSVLPQSM